MKVVSGEWSQAMLADQSRSLSLRLDESPIIMKGMFWRGEKAYDNAVAMDLAHDSRLASRFTSGFRSDC